MDPRVSKVNRVPQDHEDNSVQLDQPVALDCKDLPGQPEHPAAQVLLDTREQLDRRDLLVQQDQREQRVRLDSPAPLDTLDHRVTVDRWVALAHLVGSEL